MELNKVVILNFVVDFRVDRLGPLNLRTRDTDPYPLFQR